METILASGPPYTVAVAQLVEPRIVVPVVAGSSPVGHPTSPTLALSQARQPNP